jgi:GNAT superfamily N-acetyltransferase
MIFRDAQPRDAKELTMLTFESKKYWGYPDTYMELWTDQLTITPEYIEKNKVVLALEDGQIAGYFSITREGPEEVLAVGNYQMAGGYFLDNLFIRPDYIRTGLGKALLFKAFEHCREQKIELLHVYSDPHAQGFYEAMGAEHPGELPTKIPGRSLPIMLFRL